MDTTEGAAIKIKTPTLDTLRDIAFDYRLDLSDADLESFRGLMAGTLASYERIEEMTEPKPAVVHPRTSGYRPAPDENTHNAWYYKTSIKGAGSGPLSGKTVAIKDNVCVAGVPMMNGTSVLEGYIPESDATVVSRILEAGGDITGKATCESLCFSGGSHTADFGPVRNPHNPAYSSGGSSSGSAVLVALGEVDMAIGGDQGGSIRIPASWCGVYGLKPTHGLVPYTGAFPIELTLDHLGPMANTTADVALLLEVIAGADGLDPRQTGVTTDPYTQSLSGDVSDLRFGIVQEGFAWAGESEPDVDEAVHQAAKQFEKLGAHVGAVSVPMHRDGLHIWNGIAVEGASALMVDGNAMGTNWKGHYTTSLLDGYARARRERADDLSETTKLVMLLGRYMRDRYHGRYYAKAQNLSRTLRAAYDTALGEYDLLVMPTLPMKATPLPPVDVSREDYVARALEMISNTASFDVTGHPAMTIPCAFSSGLPVGMMLIGRHFGESTILRAAHAFEKAVDWKGN